MITWDSEKMATGVPAVDAQHQEWIRRYNEFDEAVNQGKGLAAVASTLEFFASYAETHFKLEESYMEDLHCPAAAANRAAHEQMRNILSGFRAYVRRQGVSMFEVAALRKEMKEWLVKHILTVDIQLRGCSPDHP